MSTAQYRLCQRVIVYGKIICDNNLTLTYLFMLYHQPQKHITWAVQRFGDNPDRVSISCQQEEETQTTILEAAGPMSTKRLYIASTELKTWHKFDKELAAFFGRQAAFVLHPHQDQGPCALSLVETTIYYKSAWHSRLALPSTITFT